MCQLGQEAVDALGPMLTFLITKGNKRQETAAVHTLCVAWSPRVHFVGNEEKGAQQGFAMVPEEVRRARQLRCCQCKRSGAAMGCDVASCHRTYHMPCAMLQEGTYFSLDDWRLFCPEHAPPESHEEEQEDMQDRRYTLRHLLGASDDSESELESDGAPPQPDGSSASSQGAAAALDGEQLQEQQRQEEPAAKHQRVGEAAAAEPAAPVTSLPQQLQPSQQQQQQPLAGAAPRPPSAASRSQGLGGSLGGGSNGGSAPAGTAPAASGLEQEPAVQQEQQQLEQQPQAQLPGQPPEQQQPEEAEGGGVAGLPADVRALVREVYGTVFPETVAVAEECLWREGVRSFSDLRDCDMQHYWEQVPSTRMCLNKMFMLVAEREAAATAAQAEPEPGA